MANVPALRSPCRHGSLSVAVTAARLFAPRPQGPPRPPASRCPGLSVLSSVCTSTPYTNSMGRRCLGHIGREGSRLTVYSSDFGGKNQPAPTGATRDTTINTGIPRLHALHRRLLAIQTTLGSHGMPAHGHPPHTHPPVDDGQDVDGGPQPGRPSRPWDLRLSRQDFGLRLTHPFHHHQRGLYPNNLRDIPLIDAASTAPIRSLSAAAVAASRGCPRTRAQPLPPATASSHRAYSQETPRRLPG